VAPFVTATIIALTFYVGYRFQKASKLIDVLNYCRSRYDALVYEKKPLTNEVDLVKQYERRYWELQLEQFTLWMDHFIPDEIYQHWSRRRFVERDQELVGGVTMNASWSANKADLISPPFVRFIDRLFASSVHEAFDWALRRRRKQRLGRKLNELFGTDNP
jgi:hypothetical protein